MIALYASLGCILALCAIVLMAKRWGAAASERDAYEEAHDDDIKARKIDDEVARLSDAMLADELRRKPK